MRLYNPAVSHLKLFIPVDRLLYQCLLEALLIKEFISEILLKGHIAVCIVFAYCLHLLIQIFSRAIIPLVLE